MRKTIKVTPARPFGSLQGKKLAATVFCNSGKTVEFKGKEIKIVNSGIYTDDTPFVELKPKNRELTRLMMNELKNHRNFTVLIGGTQRLVLGKKTYAYW